jgi:hypothetical protein
MALQFNSFSANNLANSYKSGVSALFSSSGPTMRLRVYTSNVALPSSPINQANLAGGLPDGHVAEFANLATSVSGSTLSITGGNLTITATGSGPVTWFAFYDAGNITRGALCSDSLSLAGGGAILSLNSLTATASQTLTISAFNLALIGLNMATLLIPSSMPNCMASGSLNFGTGSLGLFGTGTTNGAGQISGNENTGISLLIIYKGTPETFPSFTDRASRASDVLITFSLPGNDEAYQNLGYSNNTLNLILGRNATLTAATASGTATWFLLCRAGTTSLTDKGAMIGNVGALGSGADLVIANTDIQSGVEYNCSGINLRIPQIWDV